MSESTGLPAEMWAVTVRGGKRAVRVPVPSPQNGEALVRVECVGICGTDLEMFRGYTTFQGIIGHEFAGVVVQADDPRWVGARVTSGINFLPGNPEESDWKKVKHNPERTALGIRGRDGVMAEFAVIPQGGLHRLPDGVDFSAGAMAEPLAAAVDAVDRLPADTGKVLLVGDGRIGQLVARVLVARGYRLSVSGKHPRKLQRLEELGAKRLSGEDISAGRKFPMVIEAAGSGAGVALAIEAVEPEGTLVLNSTLSKPVEMDLDRVVVNEIRLVGSRCGDTGEALRLIAGGVIKVDDLVTATYPLQDVDRAFQRAVEPDALKIQLLPHRENGR